MTQDITVTAILHSAEQGKIGLDDPIGKYIDGVSKRTTKDRTAEWAGMRKADSRETTAT